MTPAMLGSVGAGRVMRAASPRVGGWAVWRLPDGIALECGAGKWSLLADNEAGGWSFAAGLTRDTARLILRGLLAPGMVGEFVEWTKKQLGEWLSGDELVMELLDKLRAMGVEVTR